VRLPEVGPDMTIDVSGFSATVLLEAEEPLKVVGLLGKTHYDSVESVIAAVLAPHWQRPGEHPTIAGGSSMDLLRQDTTYSLQGGLVVVHPLSEEKKVAADWRVTMFSSGHGEIATSGLHRVYRIGKKGSHTISTQTETMREIVPGKEALFKKKA